MVPVFGSPAGAPAALPIDTATISACPCFDDRKRGSAAALSSSLGADKFLEFAHAGLDEVDTALRSGVDLSASPDVSRTKRDPFLTALRASCEKKSRAGQEAGTGCAPTM